MSALRDGPVTSKSWLGGLSGHHRRRSRNTWLGVSTIVAASITNTHTGGNRLTARLTVAGAAASTTLPVAATAATARTTPTAAAAASSIPAASRTTGSR